MTEFKDFNESRIREYSLEELRGFVNEINMKISVLNENCASEIDKLIKEDAVDVFSSSGSRKVKKVAKKYSPLLSGAEEYLKIINKEIEIREKLEEEEKYSGRSLAKQKIVSEEDFIKREQDKTWAYRSKIE